jgi:cyclopropane-fatty-acyl-phospholipid synthase
MEKVLTTVLSRLVKRGALTIVTARGNECTFGDGSGEEVRVRFLDPGAERATVLNPELRVGELFMNGRLVVERGTIYDFLALVLRDAEAGERSLPARLLGELRYLTRRAVSHNSRWRARRNVAHHYDLDHRLYELFLDPDQQYSCAYFERPDCTLEEAQLAKKRLITAKLALDPDSRVLDIALQDYRETEGSFDRIVSVGMFEHVGPRFYPTYFNKCRQLLKPDGVMVLHTIGHLDGPWYPNPWLDKYIFPGGLLPALSEIVPEIERAGLLVTDVECLRMHYAETLLNWRRRFMARRDEALALYDERFCRMWEYYLACCEAAFRYQNVAVFQIQCARRADALPLTRAYIAERYEDLRLREAEAKIEPPRAAGEPVPLRKQRL